MNQKVTNWIQFIDYCESAACSYWQIFSPTVFKETVVILVLLVFFSSLTLRRLSSVIDRWDENKYPPLILFQAILLAVIQKPTSFKRSGRHSLGAVWLSLPPTRASVKEHVRFTSPHREKLPNPDIHVLLWVFNSAGFYNCTLKARRTLVTIKISTRFHRKCHLCSLSEGIVAITLQGISCESARIRHVSECLERFFHANPVILLKSWHKDCSVLSVMLLRLMLLGLMSTLPPMQTC